MNSQNSHQRNLNRNSSRVPEWSCNSIQVAFCCCPDNSSYKWSKIFVNVLAKCTTALPSTYAHIHEDTTADAVKPVPTVRFATMNLKYFVNNGS
jgi:hypothetical protein